jgi:hypothetical protein
MAIRPFLKGYLSNWYKSEFTVDGIKFANSEQWMMYQKAKTFGDEETAKKILASTSPSEIKGLGRKVKNYNDTVWNGVRQIVVFEGLKAKFGQNEDLKKQLLATGDDILVECNPTDSIWAIRMSGDDPRVQDISKWQGQNLLGFTLMLVRDYFKKNN